MPAPRATAVILTGAALLFAILQLGVSWLATRVDLTWASLAGTAVALCTALALERFAFAMPLAAAPVALGLGRPRVRALVAATLVVGSMLAFFPALAAVTGTPVHLHAHWPWILLGAVTLNGVGEELLFRGWVFGHLRRHARLGFARAGLVSMAIFAAVHLLLLATAPLPIALGAVAVAIAASFPTAWLYERGGATIWAPAILHTGAHAIRLVELAPAVQLTAMLAWMAVQLTAGALVFALRRAPSEPSLDSPAALR